MRVIEHPLYSVWKGLFTRCYNKNSKDYKYYGAKGITVCDSWSIKGGQGFWNFVNDMAPRPVGTTLDRINRNKGYSKDNCRWTTPLEQVNNRGIATSITYNGETHTATEWEKIVDVSRETIYHRINYLGWSPEKTLTTPMKKAKRGKKIFLDYHGKKVSLANISKITGVTKGTIQRKLKLGWTIDEIIKEPRTPWGKLKI